MKRLIGLGWFVGTWCSALVTACSGGSDEESAGGGGSGGQATGGSATGGNATGGTATGGTSGGATGGSLTGGAAGSGAGAGVGGASGAGSGSGGGSGAGSGGKGGSGGGAGEWTCEDLGGEICFCRLGGEAQTLPACEGAMWTCCALSAMNCQCFAGLSDADCEATIAVDSRLTRAPSCPP